VLSKNSWFQGANTGNLNLVEQVQQFRYQTVNQGMGFYRKPLIIIILNRKAFPFKRELFC
jgi:hypothetical protein